MTKETKIGLIVGLAFIILFAIILSEKGAKNATKAPSALTLADASRENKLMGGGSGEPLNDAGRLPIQSEPMERGHRENVPGGDSSMNERPLGRPIPGEDEPILPLPESVVNRLNMGMDETEIAPENLDNRTDSPSDNASLSVTDAVASALSSTVGDDEQSSTNQGSASSEFNPHSDVSAIDSNTSIPPVRRTPTKLLARHQVKAGESLGKIAARYYGRATPARIDAIFNANRDTLASVNSVRADALLNIPQLDGIDGIAFEPARNFAPADVLAQSRGSRDRTVLIPMPVDNRSTSASRTRNPIRNRTVPDPAPAGSPKAAPPAFTWYQVRKRDTLSRIARRELGNERLFLNIFKMNRDIIQDLNRIKPGMKIRLPNRTSALQAATASMTARVPETMVP